LSLNRNEKAAVVTDVSAQAARRRRWRWPSTVASPWKPEQAAPSTRATKGVYLHVLKNTLARRAVAGTPFEVAQGAWSAR
jgi:large subunit ribosomal protein L10